MGREEEQGRGGKEGGWEKMGGNNKNILNEAYPPLAVMAAGAFLSGLSFILWIALVRYSYRTTLRENK